MKWTKSDIKPKNNYQSNQPSYERWIVYEQEEMLKEMKKNKPQVN